MDQPFLSVSNCAFDSTFIFPPIEYCITQIVGRMRRRAGPTRFHLAPFPQSTTSTVSIMISMSRNRLLFFT